MKLWIFLMVLTGLLKVPTMLTTSESFGLFRKMVRNLPRYISRIGKPVFPNGVFAKNFMSKNKLET